MTTVCPVCGKDDQIQKASTIKIPGAPNGGKLTPPPKPSAGLNPRVRSVLLIVVTLFVAAFYVFLGLALSNVLLLGFAALCAGFLFFIPRLNQRYQVRYQQQLEARKAWTRIVDRWKDVYYCARDRCLFDPNASESISPTEEIALVAKQPDTTASQRVPTTISSAPNASYKPHVPPRYPVIEKIGILLTIMGVLSIVAAVLSTSLNASMSPDYQSIWLMIRLLGSGLIFAGLAIIAALAVLARRQAKS